MAGGRAWQIPRDKVNERADASYWNAFLLNFFSENKMHFMRGTNLNIMLHCFFIVTTLCC